MHPKSVARVIAAVPVLLLALVSCSDDGHDEEKQRDYATPTSLCGTPVDADELSKFLPPGKKVTVKETVATSRASRCAVSVDGKAVVYTAQEWWNDMSVLNFAQGLTEETPEHRTDDGRYAYADKQGFGKTTDCHNSKHSDQVLFTAVQATRSDHEDAEAMLKLISGYTKEVEASSSCT
ncbi:hypothetical protein [Streptomyces sp. NPDC016845]|uniref:hypothetical protein n=1 Tax=Streptomyces sp. NPDC016845 TaxID=3364972 RepID=UPI0037B60389